ncbi:porin [Extensimonas vulgaris]|uniref:Putative porin n=1 Tax=Extensimonas vulgaris TaxID=1031594 RepID=A0A369AL36_9BURK|nr:porin [Extensimonas vulgaris]RCX10082.1 putative porin [Extensimonas vulgaris]TWI36521.1 putative porin [Extensimonas vulgaris]TXD17235.1 porin [Extensimonas vulgaris]
MRKMFLKGVIGKAALFICACASAQSSVQVAGVLDVYAGSMRFAGDAARVSAVGSGGLTSSWFGLQGSEDLGNGIKANFSLTSFVRMDTGEPGRFTNDPFFSRSSNVGLSGGFGSFYLGRGLAPSFMPGVLANPFAASTTVSPLLVHMYVPSAHWVTTVPADTVWPNQIVYTTPNIYGLKATLQYQLGEIPGDNGKKNVGGNLIYTKDALTLTAFYESAQIKNFPPISYSGTTKKDWMISGAYDFNVVKTYLSYGQSKADNNPSKAKTTQIGVSIPIFTSGKILGSFAETKRDVVDTSRKTLTVGYDYNFSKRTDVYAVAMSDKLTNTTTGNSFLVGIRHGF